ncbi:MAG: tetratricopeptide repeat protein [Myxococcales bacterium]|nr:MAG: tetratricopeptide repeat protein [Myxococcales bacterium]
MVDLRIVVVFVVSGLLSGCFLWTSRPEGDDLKTRMTKLEQGLIAERDKLEKQLLEAKEKIQKLEELLERATRVLSENKTDTELRVQELEVQSDSTQGMLAEIRNALDQLKEEVAANEKRLSLISDKMGVEEPLAKDEVPQDKAAHFAAAMAAYNAKSYSKARSLFVEFVRRYSKDASADDAQYWIAMSHLRQERPATALGEFRKVIAEYPKGDVMDKALLSMATAFWELHACTDAKNALLALIKQYPKSSFRDAAQKELSRVRAAPRGYCTS